MPVLFAACSLRHPPPTKVENGRKQTNMVEPMGDKQATHTERDVRTSNYSFALSRLTLCSNVQPVSPETSPQYTAKLRRASFSHPKAKVRWLRLHACISAVSKHFFYMFSDRSSRVLLLLLTTRHSVRQSYCWSGDGCHRPLEGKTEGEENALAIKIIHISTTKRCKATCEWCVPCQINTYFTRVSCDAVKIDLPMVLSPHFSTASSMGRWSLG